MIRLAVLADEAVEAIHQATLRILSEVGIVLTQPEAREVLAGAGATVRGDRVLLPPDLVEREVARCPRQVTVRGRSGQTVVLGAPSSTCIGTTWAGHARCTIPAQATQPPSSRTCETPPACWMHWRASPPSLPSSPPSSE